MADRVCSEHGEYYDGDKYSSCYQCYRERRSMYVDCIFCGKWHDPKFNTCFQCRQITDRDEAARNLRLVIMARDRFTCAYCGDTESPLQVDHVLPCALGGTAAPWNLQTLCNMCNFEKADSFDRHAVRHRARLVDAYLTYLWQYLSAAEQGRLVYEMYGVTPREAAEALAECRAGPHLPMTEEREARLRAAFPGRLEESA